MGQLDGFASAVFFVVGYFVDEHHNYAVIALIEKGVRDHHAIARLYTDIAIGLNLHHLTSNDFSP